MDGRVTRYDLDLNHDDDDDDDSNTFEHSYKYQKEFNYIIKTSEQDLAIDKTQDKYFQDTIQQHNTTDTEPTNNNTSTSSRKVDDNLNL